MKGHEANPAAGKLALFAPAASRPFGEQVAAALATVLDSDVTDATGFFRIPIFGEDFGLRVNGRTRGFENGWRACNGTVVPTWGAACQSPIGRIGKVRLDRR